MTHSTASIVLAGILCSACSASPKINLGNEPDGSIAGTGGTSGLGGSGGFGGGGGGDNRLTALIAEPPSEMSIEVVTIGCAGECKQVLAIAYGGNEPYTFHWNDGVTTAAREVCADEDTTFTVTVNDTAIVDGEFPYAAQTVTASVTAQVLTCPVDGGVDGSVDAATADPQQDAGDECFDRPGSIVLCPAQPNFVELHSVGDVQDGRSYTLPLGGALPAYVGTMRLWGTDATCTERVLLAEFFHDGFGTRVCFTPENDHARLLIELANVGLGIGSFGFSCLQDGC